ncbi:hypothetical protein [Gluconacetobacter tumulisoli]|uniref:Uncharacterized protein n=1 Tax=Gluconacetobacter tumulisoli TaxID=1286189 RepID=A0A7W4K5Q6_9PROT|nr:hypothetical protein [Gluconacetobacter tumulisoli]MBB2200732.1 hypothetical protein [Gluconacetobacter tumulisoli]
MQTGYVIVAHTGSLIAVDPEGMFHIIPGFLHQDGRPLLRCDAALRPCVARDGALVPIDGLACSDPQWTDGAARIGLRRGDRYGSVHPNGTEIEFDRDTQQGWEYFLLLPEADLPAIARFAERAWLVPDAGQVVTPARATALCAIHAGKSEYRIDENIQALRALPPDATDVVLTRRTYCIGRFVAYRPLVYYACFGADAQFALLRASLDALLAVGRYDGDLCIITDRDDLRDWIPERFAGTLHILRKTPTRHEEFWRSRYEIADLEGIGAYGPILYVDTDVCAVADISIILHRIALSGKICVGTEEYPASITNPPSLLTVADSMGGTLFRMDGHDPGYRFGFNSGIIGFASMRIARDPFRRVAGTMDRLLRAGTWIPFMDQAVANYLFHKLGIVDTETLSGHVQAGTPTRLYSHVRPADTQVLVHFWATPGKDRETILRAMTATRLAERAAREAGRIRQHVTLPPSP